MPHKFRLARPALDDIDSIWDSVFERSRSVEVADKVLVKLFDAFDLLDENPEAGHPREDLTKRPLKFWAVYDYLIVYRPGSSPIEIAAVIHGARDVGKILKRRIR